jgi:methyl-accepting chemotaxis protein
MIKLLKTRLGLRIAVSVNTMLIIVITLGCVYLIKQYNESLEEQFRDKAKMMSILGAKGISSIIEQAIDNGALSLSDAFDTNYVQIPGIDPPKYHTKYDAYLDKAILPFEDEFLKDKSVNTGGLTDVNGYIPTHNTPFSQPLTGNPEIDKAKNRTKRILKDPVSTAAAKNTTEGFQQTYKRDIGTLLWDTSTPVYVKGKHWGCFRVNLSPARIDVVKQQQAMALIIVMVVVLCFSGFTIFLLIQKALAPLRKFTSIASDLADGNVEEKIEATSEDEIGQLANVLERLRISIKSAMERLMKK